MNTENVPCIIGLQKKSWQFAYAQVCIGSSTHTKSFTTKPLHLAHLEMRQIYPINWYFQRTSHFQGCFEAKRAEKGTRFLSPECQHLGVVAVECRAELVQDIVQGNIM